MYRSPAERHRANVQRRANRAERKRAEIARQKQKQEAERAARLLRAKQRRDWVDQHAPEPVDGPEL